MRDFNIDLSKPNCIYCGNICPICKKQAEESHHCKKCEVCWL